MKFNFDNKFINGLGKIVDCAWLSILWVLCCIPIVTIGTSCTALYYTVHKSIRGNRGYTTRTFFTAFKDNFKQSILSYLVWLVVMVVLVMDLLITRQVLQTGSSLGMFFYFFIVVILFAVMWGIYLMAYVARFENTVKATLKNAVLLEIRHLPWSLLILLISLISCFLIWLRTILLILVPAAAFLLFDLILERIFRLYMSPEDLERELENDKLDELG